MVGSLPMKPLASTYWAVFINSMRFLTVREYFLKYRKTKCFELTYVKAKCKVNWTTEGALTREIYSPVSGLPLLFCNLVSFSTPLVLSVIWNYTVLVLRGHLRRCWQTKALWVTRMKKTIAFEGCLVMIRVLSVFKYLKVGQVLEKQSSIPFWRMPAMAWITLVCTYPAQYSGIPKNNSCV